MTGKSIRDQYVQPAGDDKPEAQAVVETENHLPPYEAFDRGQASPRPESAIKIFYEDGIYTEILFYNYILRAIAIEENIIIIYSTEGVYQIEGLNILDILDQLHDQKLRFLRAYNKQLHAQPAANAPVIYRIEYFTVADWRERERARAEVRPPVNAT